VTRNKQMSIRAQNNCPYIRKMEGEKVKKKNVKWQHSKYIFGNYRRRCREEEMMVLLMLTEGIEVPYI
jgi:hypothetical protein